jgi:hypothetical protein
MKLPQLTLRDLFWLVLVAALICGWWLDHRRIDQGLIDSQNSLEKTIHEQAVFEAKMALLGAELNASRAQLDASQKAQRALRQIIAERLGGSLTLESEFHQKLIEGKPIQ